MKCDGEVRGCSGVRRAASSSYSGREISGGRESATRLGRCEGGVEERRSGGEEGEDGSTMRRWLWQCG